MAPPFLCHVKSFWRHDTSNGYRLKILGNEKVSNWLKTQRSTKCSLPKQKFGHSAKKMEKHSIELRRLISNISWKIVGLFLPSTPEILDFVVSLSILPALNDSLESYDFVLVMMGNPKFLKAVFHKFYLVRS